MCGIFVSLSRREHILPDAATEKLLESRGPDETGVYCTTIVASPNSPPVYATFFSTVLSLRGSSIVEQPLQDPSSESVLCWNGEAWTIHGTAVEGNDSQRVFDALLQACENIPHERRIDSIRGVISVLASIRGPFAFVFYDSHNGFLYAGRDCLGRRSLLQTQTADALIVSSISDGSTSYNWIEVDAAGMYYIDLKAASLQITEIPHRPSNSAIAAPLSLPLPFPDINWAVPSEDPTSESEHLDRLEASLRRALEFRVRHVRESVEPPDLETNARIAVLFSGGLDCTILARLSHDIVPPGEPIDLLNVAFENPRIHGKLDASASPYDLCPDRVTGRASYAELVKVCPDRRWRFVEINVPYTETVAHRRKVMTLMHPHNTEMDLSISYALYFASKGAGMVTGSEAPPRLYTTSAHVLLSGLGADELFGGYQRHATAFSRGGYLGLLAELDLDFKRLGQRNLGRDDRVIGDSGREVRFPFLDEDFITVALELPVWAKCDFGAEQDTQSDDPARCLEPAKRILRLLAWKLGMKSAAAEKKRAIQFGARTAKMETGKTKGTQVVA